MRPLCLSPPVPRYSPWTTFPPSGCSCLSSLLQPRLTGDKLLLSPPPPRSPPEAVGPPRDVLTWSAELAHGGAPRLVVDAAQAATFGHAPGGGAGPAVPLLGRVVELHVGGPLRQVLAVVAQAVLGDLDGVEVALRTPLGGQRNAWAEGTRGRKGGKERLVKVGHVFKMRERGCSRNHLCFKSDLKNGAKKCINASFILRET